MGSMKYIAALLILMSMPAHAQAPAKGQMLTALPSASLPLGGSEWMYLVQGDQDRKSPASSVGQILWTLPGVWTMPQTFDVTPGTSPLVLNGNTGTVPSPTPTAALQIVGSNGIGLNVDGYTYGGGFFYQGRRSDGTQVAPTAVVLNDNLVGVGGWGFDGTGFGTVVPADFLMRGAETFTPSAHGTYMVWRVTPTGSITKAEAMRLQDSGTLTIGATAASGAAKLQVTGGTLTDKASVGAGLLTLSSGELGISKIAASGVAPGSSGGKLSLVCGTNPGTAKLVITAGTSTTPATVVDNIGAGVAGC